MRHPYIATSLATLLLAIASLASSGTTGKIMGRVTDAEGDPLPGASVMIEGTQRGTEADADGVYFLLAVPPGHHTLVASMIGYATQRKEAVVVSADFTSNAFFGLEECPVELDRVVVAAHRWRRPPVDLDRTSTVHVVSAEEIEQAPIVRTTGELVSMQPGVDQAGTFSVRGSHVSWGTNPRAWGTQWNEPNDVSLIIDGIRIPNQDGNGALLFAGVNKSAMQQISIETGVLPSEYGDAQAGAVNIVTREGGRDFHGWTELHYEPAGRKHWGPSVYDDPIHRDHMKWDDPEWVSEADTLTGRVIHQRADYTSWSGFSVEGSLFGPIGPKVSFSASINHQHRAAVYPSAESHGFYNDRGDYINAPDNIQGCAIVTCKPTGGTKLKAGLILQRYTAWNDEINEYNYARHGFIRGLRNVDGRNLFLPEKWASSGRYLHQEDLEYLSLSHALSPRTFYELRLARSRTLQDTVGVPLWTETPRQDRDGWFFIDRQVAMWVASDRKRYTLKADLSSQINNRNLAKAGLEITAFDATYTYWGAPSKARNSFSFYAGGDTPWEMGSPARPLRGACYVQDKMEYAGLIVNTGLRLDFNVHRHRELVRAGLMWAPMWKRYTDRHYAYGVGTGEGVTVTGDFARVPPIEFHLSPRLGVSHPITDQAAMHFSLGRCVQWLDLYDLYAKTYTNFKGSTGPDGDPSWEDVNGNGVKDPAEHLSNMVPLVSGFGGDPWIRPEETLTFEVGAQWNFVSDYTGSLTLFYRSETQQIARGGSAWRDPKYQTVVGLRGLGNANAGYSRGIELAVEKRMSHYVSFRVAWSTQWSARGNMGLTQWAACMFPDSNLVVSGEFWYDFRPNPDGSRTAIPLSDAQKYEIGTEANREIRYRINYARNLAWMQFGKMTELQDKAIYASYLTSHLWGFTGAVDGEKIGGILSQANVQVVLNTPSDVRLGSRWMGWLARNLSVNVLWRMRSGRLFTWTTPEEAELKARGPVDTVTDLSVEKVFNAKDRVRPSFFVEVRNLFNDRIDTDVGKDYVRWGLQMPYPDNSAYLKYGDEGGRRYFSSPRRTNLGFRVVF